MDERVERLVSCISRLRDNANDYSVISDIKLALNTLLSKDARCNRFIYTLNTDKVPFGCTIFPVLTQDVVENLLIVGKDSVRFSDYNLEIDSKLFDYDLSDEEIVAMMLYNVYHLVADFTPAIRVREMVDAFLTNRDEILDLKSTSWHYDILEFGICDAVNQMVSCLSLPDEVETDTYLESLGLDCLASALDKVYKEIPGCENEINRRPNLSMLNWALRLYKDTAENGVAAVKLLDTCRQLTASALYIGKMSNLINSLQKIDLYSESANVMLESKRKGFFAALKYSGLRDIEDDLYEFIIRAKNAETEMDAMYALKQINSRLTILDDYIHENPDDPEIDRWRDLSNQYRELRDNIAKTKLYNRRNYGVFIDYNAIDAKYDNM